MQSLTNAQRQLVDTVATKNSFSEYEVECESGSSKGDNYLGLIVSVVVKENDRRMNLILKASKPTEAIPIHKAYIRETAMYKEVLKEFDNFQKKFKPVYPFKGYAKFYGASEEIDHEFLLMDDLKAQGFKMWDRKVPMNSAHITAGIKEYAKLHSLSFAMRKQHPDKIKEFEVLLTDIFMADFSPEKLDIFFTAIVNKCLTLVKDNKIASDAIEKFTSNVGDYYTKDIADPSLNLVVTHGDCWCNNILFHYKNPNDTSEPEQVCFIDWQLSKYGSPASDLVYFLFASSDKENLYNYKKYLRCYHDVLSENLRSMGCDPEELYPYSMLEKHFKLHAKFGLNLAIMILRVIMCEMDEAPDMANVKKDSDFTDLLNFKFIHEEAYRKRILDLVLFMVDNDLF